MKKKILFIIGSLFFTTSTFAETVDRIAAVVGGDIITLSDVKNYSASRSFEKKHLPGETRDPLQALIREKLIQQEMTHLGIEASDQDIASAVQDVLQRNHASLEGLKAELSKKGTSYEKYKKDLGEQIRQMKFLGQVIYPRIRLSDDEISKKSAGDSSEEGRFKARMKLLEERSPEEIDKFVAEIRSKTLIEIKK